MANLLSSLKNKGFSSIGSIAGVGLLVATPLVAMTMIALVIAQRGSIRADFGLGGGSTAGLEKVEENVTLYVTTYYPGNGNQSVEGDCQTAAGEDNGPRGNFFYLKSSTGEIVDYCKKSSSEKLAMINDNDYQLISVFSTDKQRYAFGGVAVNNNSWPGGTPFPIYGRVNNVRNGHTYWLEIPGLEGLTPVVDHFGSATGNNKAAQNRMLKQGKDMRYRVDIAIKAAGDSDSAHIDPFLQKIGCDRSEGAGGVFTCSVKGVNVFFGNPFENPRGSGSTNDIVRIAMQQRGIKGDGNDNRGAAIDKYFVPRGGNGQLSPSQGQPWCAYFVTWVLDQAGVSGITRQGAVDTLKTEMQTKFTYFDRGSQAPQPGDVFFEAGVSHTGIIVEVVDANTVKTIEGNTGGDDVGYNTSNISRFSGFGRVSQ